MRRTLAESPSSTPFHRTGPGPCGSEAAGILVPDATPSLKDTMLIGHIDQLWRHPVKSMRGDQLQQAVIGSEWGIPGDRGWALRDEEAGEIRGAKQLPKLLQFHARYLHEPHADAAPAVEITFPDGSQRRSDDADIDQALSDVLGRRVTLWSRQPADDYDHYRRARVSEKDIRQQLDLDPGDPIPDFSTLPPDIMKRAIRFATPPGTYFDTMPLSLLTTASMDALSASTPESVIDPRRFRKNLIVKTEPELTGHVEFDWVGRQLRIGAMLVEVKMPISRCVMTVLPQAELPHDRAILKTLVKTTNMNLGVLLHILQPATIAVGDPIELVE